ncbi:MAG TPA: hypothetical protein VNT77_04735, partial [Allosphingosinicella sp.]|nr:hypothetical protein [Allosphingosinicella sp.]
TIRQLGESGYVRFLAGRAGIKTQSLEPSPPEQVRMLLEQFPADQVMLFFILREAARLRDREGLASAALDGAVAKLLERMQPMAAAIGVEPIADIAALEAAAGRYWPGRDWRGLPAGWFSPLGDDEKQGSVFTAAINRTDSMNRNRHMVRLLAAAVKAGERPFAVVGRNHVPMQVPALRCLLGEDG